jgi:hypothetical protein
MQAGKLWVLALAAITLGPSAQAQWSLDVEAGLARNPYNRFRIPGSTGTMVSVPDDFGTAVTAFSRYRVTYSPNPRDSWSLLIAPLALDSHGTAPMDISFHGSTFAAGTALDIHYVFNSYRLTYRRTFPPQGRLTWGVGLTAKVRDAEIRLTSDTQTASRTDLGVVPLINFHADWWIGGGLSAVLDGDALAAPQGRAEDVMLALKYRLADTTQVRLGYRILEGGADNDSVYTFSRVEYTLVGVEYGF